MGWAPESHFPQTPHLRPRPEEESPENPEQQWGWEPAWEQPLWPSRGLSIS